MSRQLWPTALLVFAAFADATGRPDLALYAVLVAVPVIAAAALKGYGDVVSGEGGSTLETSLWVAALLFAVAGASVAAFWTTALVGCLALLGVQGVLALSAELRRI